MFSRLIFWPWFAGAIILVTGLIFVRAELSKAIGLDKLIVLGRVFLAAPLAVFGAEHLVNAHAIMRLVPPWMPARLFWAYFVGFALIAAAISVVLMKYVRLSATLLGVMFFLFVVLVQTPRVMANPNDRISWAVACRDLSFAGGAWALAGTQWRVQGRNWLIVVARLCIAIPVIFFGVEHFLHAEFVPGVPLGKLTPVWIPFRVAWGYLTGAVLLVAGAGMLVTKLARTAAAGLGMMIIILVFCIYVPIFAVAVKQAELLEGLNYLADTLLFGGTALLLAAAMPRENRPQPVPAS